VTIELITGTPGAGKTTYAVATRLAVECKRQITLDTDTCLKLGLEVGSVVTRRIIVAGIRGLNLEHERIPHLLTKDSTPNKEVETWNAMKADASDEPVHGRLPDQPPVDVPAIMQNWWLWCKPGDMIVIDEAQFVMPRGSLGRKPPYWLQAMEIHRHYGVDFLIITQHPQLIDTTVRALVGLHRHIRSVMGSNVCMVYTWDHASNPERYSMASKASFVRKKKHFRLFHSSVAHVKPPSAGRWGLIVAPILLLVGLGGLAFKVNSFGGDKAPSDKAAVSAPGAAASASAPGPKAQARPVGFMDVPKLSGCFNTGDKCQCFDVDGRIVRIAASMCALSSRGFDGLVQWEPRKLIDDAQLPKLPPPPGMSAMLNPSGKAKDAD
jgi:zona occludens toxin (predicted ATPase)